VSIAAAEIGTQIHASDVTLPSGVVLQDDPEVLGVNITAPAAAEVEEEAEAAAEGEGAVAAEGEAGGGESGEDTE
jgi:large subunit ribosomal protein L25